MSEESTYFLSWFLGYNGKNIAFTTNIRIWLQGEDFSLGGLALTASCAYLYTCPFWNSRKFIEREGREWFNKSGVYLRENETKIATTNGNT